MKKKNNLIITIILGIVSILYTILVKYVLVECIGPNNSCVGFASINSWFHDLTGVNMNLYNITEYLGYLAICIALVYALIGFIEFIKRKNIFKVDREIFLLAFLYIIVIAIYLFFEKVVINYRPVLIDGILEASYPSSHTLLAITICFSAILVNKKLFEDKTKIINIIIAILGILILLGRLISGVHWLTDIIGGILISAFVLMLFYTFLEIKSK